MPTFTHAIKRHIVKDKLVLQHNNIEKLNIRSHFNFNKFR
jgi:hypothetical protein